MNRIMPTFGPKKVRTVADILGSFNTMLTELSQVAEAMKSRIAGHDAKIEEIKALRRADAEELVLAENACGKIAELTGTKVGAEIINLSQKAA